MSALHRAVLEQSGLVRAIGQLTSVAVIALGTVGPIDAIGWPNEACIDQDQLLFGVAREPVSDVVRHARTARLTIGLSLRNGAAELEIGDGGGRL